MSAAQSTAQSAVRSGGPKRLVVVLGLAAALAAGLVVGATLLMPRLALQLSGSLGDAERLRLLDQAGLPSGFPVHPGARRMAQPKQGGLSYLLREPVPDVVTWQRDALRRSGYHVISTDVSVEDEYADQWLLFQSRAGGNGAVIVRQVGRDPTAGTEVKILSQEDERLIPPPLPAR